MDVIVPTFVNAHLFWVIPKKDILLRSAMHKAMSLKGCKVVKDEEQVYEDEMYCLNIEEIWARGIIEKVVTDQNQSNYICWLPDYGVLRSVSQVYHIPDNMQKCPPIARRASLHNVVNVTTDLMLGESGYEFKTKTTIEEVNGVRKSALDLLQAAKKILFSPIDEGRDIVYGDLICVDSEDQQSSLTDSLKNGKLMEEDKNMFKIVENKRNQFRGTYFQNSGSWHQALDKTDKDLSSIIINKDKRIAMDYFKWRVDSNRLPPELD